MTGIELIAAERSEQINKHNFLPDRDKEYISGELVLCAQFVLTLDSSLYPSTWDKKYHDKMINKTYEERLVVAGALLAAEIDRVKAESGVLNETADNQEN